MFPFHSITSSAVGSIGGRMSAMLAQVSDTSAGPLQGVSSFYGAWTIAMIVPVILGAVGYVLLQKGILKSQGLTYAGIACVVLAIIIAIGFTEESFESYLFATFAALAIGGGIGFLTAREPVYAALGFATAVLSTCGVLFLQSALFVAAATMIVYAGATIIIFLFVLMFAQQKDLRSYDIQLNSPWLAATVGAIVLATITVCVISEHAILPASVDVTRPHSMARTDTKAVKDQSLKAGSALHNDEQIDTPSQTAGLGRSMYTDYLLAIELAGTVLLVATIGAIALASRPVDAPSPTGSSS